MGSSSHIDNFTRSIEAGAASTLELVFGANGAPQSSQRFGTQKTHLGPQPQLVSIGQPFVERGLVQQGIFGKDLFKRFVSFVDLFGGEDPEDDTQSGAKVEVRPGEDENSEAAVADDRDDAEDGNLDWSPAYGDNEQIEAAKRAPPETETTNKSGGGGNDVSEQGKLEEESQQENMKKLDEKMDSILGGGKNVFGLVDDDQKMLLQKADDYDAYIEQQKKISAGSVDDDGDARGNEGKVSGDNADVNEESSPSMGAGKGTRGVVQNENSVVEDTDKKGPSIIDAAPAENDVSTQTDGKEASSGDGEAGKSSAVPVGVNTSAENTSADAAVDGQKAGTKNAPKTSAIELEKEYSNFLSDIKPKTAYFGGFDALATGASIMNAPGADYLSDIKSAKDYASSKAVLGGGVLGAGDATGVGDTNGSKGDEGANVSPGGTLGEIGGFFSALQGKKKDAVSNGKDAGNHGDQGKGDKKPVITVTVDPELDPTVKGHLEAVKPVNLKFQLFKGKKLLTDDEVVEEYLGEEREVENFARKLRGDPPLPELELSGKKNDVRRADSPTQPPSVSEKTSLAETVKSAQASASEGPAGEGEAGERRINESTPTDMEKEAAAKKAAEKARANSFDDRKATDDVSADKAEFEAGRNAGAEKADTTATTKGADGSAQADSAAEADADPRDHPEIDPKTKSVRQPNAKKAATEVTQGEAKKKEEITKIILRMDEDELRARRAEGLVDEQERTRIVRNRVNRQKSLLEDAEEADEAIDEAIQKEDAPDFSAIDDDTPMEQIEEFATHKERIENARMAKRAALKHAKAVLAREVVSRTGNTAQDALNMLG